MADVREEDLFAGSSMSFGDHLEALRVALFKAVAGFAVGVIAGLFLATPVVNVIKSPLEKGLEEYYRTGGEIEYEKLYKEELAAGRTPPYTMPQIKYMLNKRQMIYTVYRVHLDTFRSEIGLTPEGTPVAPTPTASKPEQEEAAPTEEQIKQQVDKIAAEALVPVFVWQPMSADYRMSIKGLSAMEAFMIWLKAGLMAGVILSSPWVFYQLWSFVAAGLYPNEKRYVHVFLPLSIGLFLAGALLAFFFAFPFVLDYLFKYNRELGISPDPRINEWLGFALFVPIGFGLSFQLPLVMLFLNKIGLLSIETYLRKWRISVLVVFVLSMVLTPGDPYSMLAMAVPLTGLYFIGILLCKWSGPKKNLLEQ